MCGMSASASLIICSDSCSITDYENVLLGQQPYYRDHGIEGVDPEVVCFGLVLYHCAMGVPLRPGETIDSAGQAASCPVPVYEVLRKIFHPSKGQGITVEVCYRRQQYADVMTAIATATAVC